MGPAVEIFVIAIGMATMTQIVNRLLTDPSKMRDLSKKLKEVQKELVNAQRDGDHKKVERLKKEQAVHLNNLLASYKELVKPMLVTFIPVLIVFKLIEGTYSPLGEIVNVFGFSLNWLWTYLLSVISCSLVLDRIFRKVWK